MDRREWRFYPSLRETELFQPGMILRLDDIAVFTADWDNKADSIKQIQQRLKIGFDSTVFLDDNPFEHACKGQKLQAGM